jgi:hypothetical protein
MRNTKWLKNGKIRKAILSAFYNISQRNFGILQILWCSFKLWWNFCLDQNFSYKGKGPLLNLVVPLRTIPIVVGRGFGGDTRQCKGGEAPFTSSLWVWFSLWTHVKRVSQCSAKSHGFSPGSGNTCTKNRYARRTCICAKEFHSCYEKNFIHNY